MTNTWDGGKSDDALILEAIDILVDMGIPKENILKEPYMWSWAEYAREDENFPQVLTESGEPPDIRDAKGHPIPIILHRPDIAVFDMYGGETIINMVVELDGSYHDSKAGRRKTDKRNRDYKELDLYTCIINLAEYPGHSWQEWLRVVAHPIALIYKCKREEL